MSDSVLFFWNPGPFAEHLGSQGFAVVTTREQFRERLRRWRRGTTLVVLAEWTPTTGRLSELEGLKLVVELFELERPVPRIALCSFLPRSALAALEDERGEAARLMFPFVRLPASPSALAETASSAETPSRMVQVWLRDHVLSPHPFSMWEHNFKRDAAGGLDGIRRGIEQLAAKVRARRATLSHAFEDIATFERLLDDGSRAVRQGDGRAADEIRRRIEEHLRRVRRHIGRPDTVETAAPFSVVVVEDDATQRQQIVHGLQPYFTDVVGFESGGAALESLRERAQAGRRFDAVISDWDLREGGATGGIMQPLQGPDMLLRAAEHCSGPLVGLTSLPGDVVASILNAAPSDVRARLSWFPKRDAGDLVVQDYHGLAYHITAKIRESLSFREESPAVLGFKHWREHGLGDHYVSVRMWSLERQRALFAQCAARAQEIIEAFRGTEQVNDVSDAPFRLNFNVPSGAEGGPRYSFQRFQDVLCARFVVLTLYTHQSRYTRDYRTVLAALFPQMMERARDRAIERGMRAGEFFPPSFKAMMSVLGLPTRGNHVDLSKLRPMPHEVAWAEEQGLDLGLPPMLTPNEEEEAMMLAEDVEAVIRQLEAKLPSIAPLLEPPEIGQMDAVLPAALLMGEEAVTHIETVARALHSLDGEPEQSRSARLMLKRRIEVLTEEGAYEDLYAKMPDWKRKLVDVLRFLE